ncbi:MAG: hypothetical protein C0603_06540 [Denitrovibrio sp.]|nr:MAG: hypothetical protein C0603_06540 [Denitrovibrio sp.]
MDNLLDVLTTSQNFHIYLIDKDGEIIVNPEPDLSWSRYLENKPKIHKIFPNRYKELLSNSSISKQGLYMFSYADMFRNREGMRILMVPKSEIISKLKMSNVVTALLIAGIVLIVSVPLSWLASFIPSKLQATIVDAYDEIKKYTNIIDRNIATSQTDKNGVITDISSKFLEITGYQKHEVIGKNHNFLKHPETPAEHYKDMWNTISRGTVWTGEMQDLSKSGQEFWISQIITPEINHKGEIIAYTSVAQDITARKIIEKMSVTDSLTGLYNRRKIDAILSAEINRFNRYNTEFCVLLLDIDFFKKVNDNFGHQVGDDVLVNVSEILQKSIRGTDFAGRWGGEEFLIVAVQIDLQNATILAEKIRSTIEETQFNIVDHITISIGVACYQFGETVTLFLNRADEALYEAKESGRNKVIAAKGEKEV